MLWLCFQQHKLSSLLSSLSQHVPGPEFPAQRRDTGIWVGPGSEEANLGRGEERSDVWGQQKGIVDFGLNLQTVIVTSFSVTDYDHKSEVTALEKAE